MRYTRLRRAIEGGTLIGTHGTPFQGTTDKETGHHKRRKKPLLSARSEQIADLGPIHTRSGSCFERINKLERVSADGFATGGSSEEDDLPLFKKRSKASNHCEVLPKHEVPNSESPSPIISHKATAEYRLLYDARAGASPAEHPLITACSNLDRNVELPKPDPGVVSAPSSILDSRGTAEAPGAGDCTPHAVTGDCSHTVSRVEDTHPSQLDVKPSVDPKRSEKIASLELPTDLHHLDQRLNNGTDNLGSMLKQEEPSAEHKAVLEAPDSKSPKDDDSLFAAELEKLVSNSH